MKKPFIILSICILSLSQIKAEKAAIFFTKPLQVQLSPVQVNRENNLGISNFISYSGFLSQFLYKGNLFNHYNSNFGKLNGLGSYEKFSKLHDLNSFNKKPKFYLLSSIDFSLTSLNLIKSSEYVAAPYELETNKLDINGYRSGDRAPYSIGFNIGFEREFGFSSNKLSYTNLIGLSIGVAYTSFSSTIYLQEYQLWYEAIDWQGTGFQRVVSAHNVKETVNYESFGIPVNLSYRKLFFDSENLQKPISLIFSISVQKISFRSTYNNIHSGMADYEALYTWQGNGFGFEDHSNGINGESDVWLLTKQGHLADEEYLEYLNSESSGGNYKVAVDVPLNQQPFYNGFFGVGNIVNFNVGFRWLPKSSRFFSDFIFNYNSFNFNVQTATGKFIDGMEYENDFSQSASIGRSSSLFNIANSHLGDGFGFKFLVGYKI